MAREESTRNLRSNVASLTRRPDIPLLKGDSSENTQETTPLIIKGPDID